MGGGKAKSCQWGEERRETDEKAPQRPCKRMGKMWVAGWRKWVARKWVARWRLVGARGWGRAGRARAGRNFGWEMPRAVCREGVCGCAGRHCAELPVLGAASEGAHGKERRALREVPFSTDTFGASKHGVGFWFSTAAQFGFLGQIPVTISSVSYFTVPPRAHPSTGSQSGSATPGRTQVPSNRSRGLLNCLRF